MNNIVKEQSEIKYELKIKCTNLKLKESFIKVNEFEDEKLSILIGIDTTERVETFKSVADYQKTIFIDYLLGNEKTKISFQIFSKKNSSHPEGEFKTTMSELVSKPGKLIHGDLIDQENNFIGTIQVYANQIKNSFKKINFGIQIKNVESKFYGKSDPYIKCYNQTSLFHITEIKEKSTNAQFSSVFGFPLEKFNGGDMDRELIFEVYDHNSLSDDDYIGTVYLKSNEINTSTDFPIINSEKKNKPGYNNSGLLNFYMFGIENKISQQEKEYIISALTHECLIEKAASEKKKMLIFN